jgi:hypothetical protein
MIIGVENRLKVDYLVAECHPQSVGICFERPKTKEIGFGRLGLADECLLLVGAALNLDGEQIVLIEIGSNPDRCRVRRRSISIGWASIVTGRSSIERLTATESIEGSAPAKWLLSASTVTAERHG